MNAPEKAQQNNETAKIFPTKMAHFVIRAKRFQEVLAWYRQVFNMRTSLEAPVIAFLTFDEEHHRLAILNTAHLPTPEGPHTGIDHVAFTYADLSALMANYERLRDLGIKPFWCINHGPTTSMYYRDPDGNQVETQVENFPTMAECAAYFHSAAFAANPIGVDFEPDLLLEKLKGGVPLAELLKQGSAPVKPGSEFKLDIMAPPKH
jgi:catechol 2,3-dioxygenase-like lactoylglutathione lyase family enzyme